MVLSTSWYVGVDFAKLEMTMHDFSNNKYFTLGEYWWKLEHWQCSHLIWGRKQDAKL